MKKLLIVNILVPLTAIDIEAGYWPRQCDVFCLPGIQPCYCYGCCAGAGYRDGGYCYESICYCKGTYTPPAVKTDTESSPSSRASPRRTMVY